MRWNFYKVVKLITNQTLNIRDIADFSAQSAVTNYAKINNLLKKLSTNFHIVTIKQHYFSTKCLYH